MNEVNWQNIFFLNSVALFKKEQNSHSKYKNQVHYLKSEVEKLINSKIEISEWPQKMWVR